MANEWIPKTYAALKMNERANADRRIREEITEQFNIPYERDYRKTKVLYWKFKGRYVVGVCEDGEEVSLIMLSAADIYSEKRYIIKNRNKKDNSDYLCVRSYL